MEVGEIQAFSATQRKSLSTIGRACSFYASLTGGTRIATRSAMIVVHLNVYAISAADYLTSRTRSLADAVDACLSGFAACAARAAVFSICAFCVGLTPIGFVVVGIAVVGSAFGA